MTDIRNSVQNPWISSNIQCDLSGQQGILQFTALAEEQQLPVTCSKQDEEKQG